MGKAKSNVLALVWVGLLLIGCFTERGEEGKLLYGRHCASCHLENGEGLRGIIPPLANSDFSDKNRSELACIIRNGMSGPVEVNGVVYNQPMPGNAALTETDITNIINYLHNEFGSPKQKVSIGEVREQLKSCQ
ncbi:c-type cytochrome [Rufibacter roseus]|uniref:C-type cytochrome n=1 Tax=Rufibacter roseus TaxID=1567108 RepID=A0ABW2DLS3_9BACT|nr:cytochrome c [Rufibacter roseus]